MADKMVKARAVMGFVVGPGERVARGEVIEVSAGDFARLEHMGRVVIDDEPPKKKPGRPAKSAE